MGIGYQFIDRKSFDYELWYYERLKRPLRGPRSLFDPGSTNYWVFVGAAQTFGRFAAKPFPELVSSWFEMEHLNFGLAGAGPEFFSNKRELLDIINQSKLCFLQIMSGRSTSTSLLKAVGQGGVLKFKHGPLQGKEYLALEAYRELLKVYGREVAEAQILEARQSWCNAYRTLIASIHVPVICVWTSCRDYDYTICYDTADQMLGEFPHLITSEELSVVESLNVDIVGRTFNGSNEELLLDYRNRTPILIFDEEKFRLRPDWSRTFNAYYPTDAMHFSIAKDILFHLSANAEKYHITGLERTTVESGGSRKSGNPRTDPSNGEGMRSTP